MKKLCLNCNTEFETKYGPNSKRGKFCNLKCSVIYNNSHRSLTESAKKNISKGMLKYWNDNPSLRKQNGIKSSIGKYKGKSITSILDVSKRTASKILKRLNIGCCICGWKEASCDIHHINGKKVENSNGHWNLTCVCPNHHRMFHNHKLRKEDFIPLSEFFPDNWKDVYYG